MVLKFHKTRLNVFLFANDLLIIQDEESALQKSFFEVNQVCDLYNRKLSTEKTKVIVFQGKNIKLTQI